MTLTVVWTDLARTQYLDSLLHIAQEDPLSAERVQKRVEKSLQLLANFPDLGTPAPMRLVRSYPIPKTGHSFDYRRVGNEIRIQRWYRQRQKPDMDPAA